MGLCKCSKRNMTNQFCYEHRVNVCERCMVDNHKKCVVQSYLRWLQDSDYNPNCEFCQQPLLDEVCVRLVCYHVFHWACLDKYARQMPVDTAPAGYVCPACSECVFPPDNLVSPVADELRKILSDVNWARAGLGMKLLDDHAEKRPEVTIGPRPTPEGECLQMRMTDSKSQIQYPSETSRPSSLPSSTIPIPDPDDDKYKRRSAIEAASRWWRNYFPFSHRKSILRHRYVTGILFLVLLFVLIISLFSILSGDRSNNDIPMFDPMSNPNILVGSD